MSQIKHDIYIYFCNNETDRRRFLLQAEERMAVTAYFCLIIEIDHMFTIEYCQYLLHRRQEDCMKCQSQFYQPPRGRLSYKAFLHATIPW
jgi:hypothetical protein